MISVGVLNQSLFEKEPVLEFCIYLAKKQKVQTEETSSCEGHKGETEGEVQNRGCREVGLMFGIGSLLL